MNTKYVKHESIYLQLSQIYKKKIIQFDSKDIGRWCHEVERDYLKDVEHRLLFKANPDDGSGKLKVENSKAIAPRNVFQIKSVFDKYKNKVDYYYDGVYINLSSDYQYNDIYLTYYGVPIDIKTGYPLIKASHRNACYLYCRNKLYEEDYAENKIPENRWHRWQQEFSQALMAIDSSLEDMSNEDFDIIQRIIMSTIDKPFNSPINL